jgi:hypothetical protein
LLPVRSTLVAPMLPEPIPQVAQPHRAGDEDAEGDRAQQIASKIAVRSSIPCEVT